MNILRDIVYERNFSGWNVYAGHPEKNFIKQYIETYDKDFYVPLSSRVDMEDFSRKLSELSTTFIIQNDEVVAGLICSYFYQPETKRGFITLVHTKGKFRGQHLSVYLLEALKEYAVVHDFSSVSLFVSKQQSAAYNLYSTHGFELVNEGEDGRCEMRWNANKGD